MFRDVAGLQSYALLQSSSSRAGRMGQVKTAFLKILFECNHPDRRK